MHPWERDDLQRLAQSDMPTFYDNGEGEAHPDPQGVFYHSPTTTSLSPQSRAGGTNARTTPRPQAPYAARSGRT